LADYELNCANFYGTQCNSIDSCYFNRDVYQCLDCPEGETCGHTVRDCSMYSQEECSWLGGFSCYFDYYSYR
jgi:hypothetical protein